jgi:L-fuculose-phosphate aldolase
MASSEADTPPQALVDYYRRLRQHGLNDSHSGNASVSIGAAFWITPTGCCADTLEADQLVPCRRDQPLPRGASLDAPLHQAVYEAVPDAAAVIHCHGPHAIALTLDGQDFEPPDFEGQYYFHRVPVLNIDFSDYLGRSPAAVADALRDSPVAIVRGHGVYARGADLDEAFKWCASLESSARIAWLHRVISARGSEP